MERLLDVPLAMDVVFDEEREIVDDDDEDAEEEGVTLAAAV